MNYLKLKKLISDSERRVISQTNKKSSWEKINISIAMVALLIALISLWLNFKTIKLAETANEETRKSSEETKKISDKSIELANQTISYLNSISNSSNSLNKNLTDFSSTLIPLNRSLLELTSTLVYVNKLSNDQLQNLSSINTNIQKQIDDIENRRRQEEILNARRPILISYLICNFNVPKFMIFVKNIGSSRAVAQLRSDCMSNMELRTFTLESRDSVLTCEFNDFSEFRGDSVRVILDVSYTKENGDTTYFINDKYLKCR